MVNKTKKKKANTFETMVYEELYCLPRPVNSPMWYNNAFNRSVFKALHFGKATQHPAAQCECICDSFLPAHALNTDVNICALLNKWASAILELLSW